MKTRGRERSESSYLEPWSLITGNHGVRTIESMALSTNESERTGSHEGFRVKARARPQGSAEGILRYFEAETEDVSRGLTESLRARTKRASGVRSSYEGHAVDA